MELLKRFRTAAGEYVTTIEFSVSIGHQKYKEYARNFFEAETVFFKWITT
jgi:hypothetical protein